MRPLAIAAILAAGMLLAGCTGDGYLGEPSGANDTARRETRVQTLWRAPAPAHPASLSLVATDATLSGDLAPLSLASIALSPEPVTTNATRAPDPFAPRPADALALWDVSLDGERGWLVLPNASLVARADGAPIVAARPVVHAGSGALALRLATSGMQVVARPLPGQPSPPPLPPALANASLAYSYDLAFPAALRVEAAGARFFGNASAERVLTGTVTLNATRATLVTVTRAGGGLFEGPLLMAPLPEGARVRWDGNLTLAAHGVARGALAYPDGEHALDGVGALRVALRGEGDATPARASGAWSLGPIEAQTTSVRTDGVQRLGATIRLLPDLIEAKGPAGNVTRVKIILAETSGGADAEIAGYRINASTKARYVGMEPFAVTDALLDAIEATNGSIATPVMLLGLGLMLPYVAIAEAVAAFFTTLFPASVAGTIGAGEARVLTFELLLPNATSDAEILLEAQNAESARATVQLRPVP